MKNIVFLFSLSCVSTSKVETGEALEYPQLEDNSQIVIETTMGAFTIELDFDNAPVTASNFMAYVDSGFYDGSDGLESTIFHRIISDFMIQGGGETSAGMLKETFDPIVNEANNGLSNLRGTVAMARTNAPDSATSQFFVNVVDNTFLDFNESSAGYAVFASVVDGMDVVDFIASVQTNSSDKPTEDIIIESVGP